MINEMIGVLGHDSVPGIAWANEMNFVMNHDNDVGSIA